MTEPFAHRNQFSPFDLEKPERCLECQGSEHAKSSKTAAQSKPVCYDQAVDGTPQGQAREDGKDIETYQVVLMRCRQVGFGQLKSPVSVPKGFFPNYRRATKNLMLQPLDQRPIVTDFFRIEDFARSVGQAGFAMFEKLTSSSKHECLDEVKVPGVYKGWAQKQSQGLVV